MALMHFEDNNRSFSQKNESTVLEEVNPFNFGRLCTGFKLSSIFLSCRSQGNTTKRSATCKQGKNTKCHQSRHLFRDLANSQLREKDIG